MRNDSTDDSRAWQADPDSAAETFTAPTSPLPTSGPQITNDDAVISGGATGSWNADFTATQMDNHQAQTASESAPAPEFSPHPHICAETFLAEDAAGAPAATVERPSMMEAARTQADADLATANADSPNPATASPLPPDTVHTQVIRDHSGDSEDYQQLPAVHPNQPGVLATAPEDPAQDTAVAADARAAEPADQSASDPADEPQADEPQAALQAAAAQMPATTIPTAAPGAAATAPAQPPAAEPLTGEIPQPVTVAPRSSDPVKLSQTIFEGATVLPAPPKRGAAHAWSFLATLLLVPLTWYVATTAVIRLMPESLTRLQPTFDLQSVLLLLGGAVLAYLLVYVARSSSLGAFCWGIVLAITGAAIVVAPGPVAEYGNPVMRSLVNENWFFESLAQALAATGPSGILFLAGVALVALGGVSHSARRRGRKDYLAGQRAQQLKQ